MAIWSSDPFFEEDLANSGFWTMVNGLTEMSGEAMTWQTPLGYTFVLQGSDFGYRDGLPVHGRAAHLEIFSGRSQVVTITAIDAAVAALFANGMARFFEAIFGDRTDHSKAA